MSNEFGVWRIDGVQFLPPSVQNDVPDDDLSRVVVLPGQGRESRSLGIFGSYGTVAA